MQLYIIPRYRCIELGFEFLFIVRERSHLTQDPKSSQKWIIIDIWTGMYLKDEF